MKKTALSLLCCAAIAVVLSSIPTSAQGCWQTTPKGRVCSCIIRLNGPGFCNCTVLRNGDCEGSGNCPTQCGGTEPPPPTQGELQNMKRYFQSFKPGEIATVYVSCENLEKNWRDVAKMTSRRVQFVLPPSQSLTAGIDKRDRKLGGN